MIDTIVAAMCASFMNCIIVQTDVRTTIHRCTVVPTHLKEEVQLPSGNSAKYSHTEIILPDGHIVLVSPLVECKEV